jgi:hypothetical protein
MAKAARPLSRFIQTILNHPDLMRRPEQRCLQKLKSADLAKDQVESVYDCSPGQLFFLGVWTASGHHLYHPEMWYRLSGTFSKQKEDIGRRLESARPGSLHYSELTSLPVLESHLFFMTSRSQTRLQFHDLSRQRAQHCHPQRASLSSKILLPSNPPSQVYSIRHPSLPPPSPRSLNDGVQSPRHDQPSSQTLPNRPWPSTSSHLPLRGVHIYPSIP